MFLIQYKPRQKYMRIYLFGMSICRVYFDSVFYRWFVKYVLSHRMKKKLKRINKHKKIRVGFLVSEQSKWGYASVYDAFAKSENYEPVILITKLSLEHLGRKTYYKTGADCYTYFKNMGYNVELAYDEENHKYIPLNKLNIDIVFYQQPWELDDSQHPINVSKYAITGYVSYGFELVADKILYMDSFHRWLDFFFTPSQQTSDYLTSIAPDVSNIYISGYPKVDAYFDAIHKKLKKPVVIYAPHHSFEKNSLNMATFQFNGREILHLAQSTADKIDWVFKPHPRFKHAVVINNIMTQDEIEQYYNAWQKIGKIEEGGDYINMFVNSSAMITDCCSFLAEYLPSKHPVLHLINPQGLYNDVAKSFINTYYQIYNTQELQNEFNRVIIRGDDYKKSERLSKVPIVFNKQQKSGENIFNIIDKNIKTHHKH